MRQNWSYKLLALLLAVVLWAKVNSERNPNVVKPIGSVNIKQMNLPEGMVVTNCPKSIQVNATGPQSALRSLDVSKINAIIDLSQAQVGSHPVPVDYTATPHEILENLRLSPREIQVGVETLKRKTLKIEVSLQGVPPIGYVFGQASADPPSAVISGRSSLVDSVRRLNIAVSPGAAAGNDDDYYPVVALDARGSQVRGLTIEPSRVSAKLELVEARATKSVIVSPTIVGQAQYPRKVMSISVSPSSVIIYGRPNSLIDISTVMTDPVDIANASETVTRTVGLRIPSSVSTDVRTAKVVVKIGSGD